MSKMKLFATLITILFLVSVTAIAIPVSAQSTLHVDDDGVQWPGAHTMISAAITAATDGDTIIVHEGTYRENVDIDKQLTLTTASSPVIYGDTNGDGVPDGPCVKISADGVTVDGFELTMGTFGVASWGTDNSVISNNIIHDNLNVPGYAGCGILFWSNSDDFDDNVIRDNIIYSNDRQGIYIGGTTPSYISDGNTISGNTIYNNGLYRYPNGPDASAYGIQLSFADDNTIEDNEIYGHDDWFFYPGFDFAQGVYLFDSNDNVITTNYLHDNNYGVGQYHFFRTAGATYINYNNIAGNTGYGVRNFDSVVIDAENNWWGHASGPSGSGGRTNKKGDVIGKGDAVSLYVDSEPWLPQPVRHTKHDPVPPGLE